MDAGIAKASPNKRPQLQFLETGHQVSGLLIIDPPCCDKNISALGQGREIGHIRHYKHARCFLQEYVPVDTGYWTELVLLLFNPIRPDIKFWSVKGCSFFSACTNTKVWNKLRNLPPSKLTIKESLFSFCFSSWTSFFECLITQVMTKEVRQIS